MVLPQALLLLLEELLLSVQELSPTLQSRRTPPPLVVTSLELSRLLSVLARATWETRTMRTTRMMRSGDRVE